MKQATSIYKLYKNGQTLTFASEKEACEFLQVNQCTVASCYRLNCKCKGWEVEKIGLSTHGDTRTSRIFKIWGAMKERCYRINHPHYQSYGGRGITICEEWVNDYLTFKKWALNNGYTEKLTLDRINVNGNYEPSNCRWASMKEQQNNKRTNRFVVVNEERLTITQCSEQYGIPKSTVRYWENTGILEAKIADMKGVE